MLIVNQESSTASDFEFPCKPLLGPSPELYSPNPASRSFRHCVASAHKRSMLEVKMGGVGPERPF